MQSALAEPPVRNMSCENEAISDVRRSCSFRRPEISARGQEVLQVLNEVFGTLLGNVGVHGSERGPGDA